jgi:hypothetical protein
MGIKSTQLAQIKEALKTQRAKVLLTLGIAFVICISAILSYAFDTLQSAQFEDHFWTLALLELLIAAIAIVVCSRFGSLGSLRTGKAFQSMLQKLFRR